MLLQILFELLGIKMNFKIKNEYSQLSSSELYDLFIKRIKNIHQASSITGRKYTNIKVTNDDILFNRESTNRDWKLTKKELISLFDYVRTIRFNSTTLHVAKLVQRKQSPTIAFLYATNIIEKCL